jgi:hypothetical protein
MHDIKGMPGKPSWWFGLIPVTVLIAFLSMHSPRWVGVVGALTFLSLVVFGLAKKLRS